MNRTEPTVLEPWKAMLYEFRMLTGLVSLLTEEQAGEGFQLRRFAYVESACLHARVLCDFLLSKGYPHSGRDADDISVKRLLSDPLLVDRLPSIATLRNEYQRVRESGLTAESTLNKMLMHPTLRRQSVFSYDAILRELVPKIAAAWNDVQTLRNGAVATQKFALPASLAGMHAKTSTD